MEKHFTFKKVEFLIVTDEGASKALGIDSANEGSIHIFVPSDNELLKQESQNNFLSIGDNEFALIKDITNDSVLKDNFVFMPFANQMLSSFLELKVNNNRITKDEKE